MQHVGEKEKQAKDDEKAALNSSIAAKEQNEKAAQAAAAAKAFQESEYKRKYNPFEGQMHEDNGISYNVTQVTASQCAV